MKLTEERRQKINEGYNTLLNKIENSESSNYETTENGLTLLHYAAALGDKDKINWVIEKGVKIQAQDPSGNTALYYSIKYEHLDTAEILLKNGSNFTEIKINTLDIDNPEIIDYYLHHLVKEVELKNLSPETVNLILLDTAVKGYWKITETLLNLGANIDYTAKNNNHNLLFIAVRNKKSEFTEKLLHTKINLTISDNNKDTILHHAARHYPDIIPDLLKHAEIIELKSHKNIYGQTPFDVSIIHHNKDAAKLLAIDSDIDIDKYIDEYNTELPCLDQEGLIEKFSKYLSLKKQSNEFLNKEGLCNGLVFLYHMDIFFYEHLNSICGWDGTLESLSMPVKKYKNLEELMEYWLGNVIMFFGGFLTTKVLDLDQADRNSQLKFYDKKMLFLYRTIGAGLSKNMGPETLLNKNQVEEFLKIFARTPKSTGIFFNSVLHITTAKNMNNGVIDYYEPNEDYVIPQTTDMSLIADVLFRKHLHSFSEASNNEKHRLALDIFRIEEANENIYEKNTYNYFDSSELANSEFEEKTYIERSPNKFSQLHVAIITRSDDNITELLKKPFTDVNAKNIAGKTSLQLAMNSEYHRAILALVEHPNIEKDEAVDAIKNGIMTAVVKGEHNLLNDYIRHIDMIVQEPIDNPDFWAESLFIYSNKLFETAIKQNDMAIISSLLKSKIPLTSQRISPDSMVAEEFSSPLKLLIQNNLCLELLVNQMDDVNLADCDGKTALHYAAIYNRTDLISTLITKGADVNKLDKDKKSFVNLFTQKGLTALDYAKKHQNKDAAELLLHAQNKQREKPDTI